MERTVSIVIGAHFGDEGKGSLVNYLCKQSLDDDRIPVVVRFGGGPQCGHTVVQKGKRHVFNQFGSGSLSGVDTIYSQFCLFEPGAFIKELEKLTELGLDPTIAIDNNCQIITPYDRKWNQKHDIKNGSCGVGVGATMRRIENSPLRLTFGDLFAPQWIVEHKLSQIKDYYRQWNFVNELDSELELFFVYVKQVLEYFENKGTYYDNDLKHQYHDFIFEGHQGLLLDRENGLFPHVTYSHTSSRNAQTLVKQYGLDDDDILNYYVSRCYLTRHGEGPMGKEEILPLINNADETNVYNPYQGNFRTGRFDFKLYHHAIQNDTHHCGREKLAITCMDQFENTIPIRGIDGKEYEVSHKAYQNMFPLDTLFSYGPKFLVNK